MNELFKREDVAEIVCKHYASDRIIAFQNAPPTTELEICQKFAEDLKYKLRRNSIFETITNAEDKNVFEIIDETLREMRDNEEL